MSGQWKGNSNPRGPGGSTRKIQTNIPRGKTSHGGGGGKKKDGCCAMAAAGRAARRGQYRLARRYAVMSVRLVAARLA